MRYTYDQAYETWNSYEERYFEWLVIQISSPEDGFDYEYWMTHYRLLLRHLYLTSFVWTIERDENRAFDGIELREEFTDETGDDTYLECCGRDDCSMLEMMVALARRIEADIMYQNHKGDRTYFWFYQMLINAGFDEFDESKRTVNFDCYDDYIDVILNHRYAPDGANGGLFQVDYIPERDFRETELWYQMQIWIRKYYDFEGKEEIYVG